MAKLGVKPQSLYASVSRGRIRAKPDPHDPRRSLYSGADVQRLAEQGQGRRAAASVAAETIRWGDPVLDSAITTVASGRLWFRGVDVRVAAERVGLEEVAQLLWQADVLPRFSGDQAASSPFAALSRLADGALPSLGRHRLALLGDAVEVVGTLLAAVAGPGEQPAATRLARHWRADDAEEAIRSALVMLADHELNASTFAARVAVSTGASLAAAAMAGLAALSGPRHGTAAAAVRSLAERAAHVGCSAAIRERLDEGRGLPALGHPLYPDGDIRAETLLARFTPSTLYVDLAAALETTTGERPNIDFALAALADRFGLPSDGPFQIFAISRSVGWLAHMLEQLETGTLIRPRARYIGPPPLEPAARE